MSQRSNEEQVRELAYQIWETEGRPEGREQDHWVRAEKAIADRQHPKGKKKVTNK
jgi:hypothetical protein